MWKMRKIERGFLVSYGVIRKSKGRMMHNGGDILSDDKHGGQRLGIYYRTADRGVNDLGGNI